VSAAQNGTWTVGITGTPTVALASGSTVSLAANSTLAVSQSGSWNVGLTGTPSVAATQSGAWSVSLAGTPSVGISTSANTVKLDPNNNTVKLSTGLTTPLFVRDVHDAVEPFQTTLPVHFTDGQDTLSNSVSVSAGKRLVVESVSCAVQLPQGQQAYALWSTDVNGTTSSRWLELAYQQTNVTDNYTGNSTAKAYADPGTNVTFACNRNSQSGTADAALTVSGYLIDLP
jgi:hypothetical protein